MEELYRLFAGYTGREPESVREVGSSGSPRKYLRMRAGDTTLIGSAGTDADENRAFFTIGRNLRGHGIAVPEVLAVSEDGMCYLQQDLGEKNLFGLIDAERGRGEMSPGLMETLRATMSALPKIQFEGARGLDWNVCYPEPYFGRTTVMFDLNYFKYCFLKSTGLPFNEILLQKDFERLSDDLCSDGTETFMYRDFQSRNVMIHDGKPWFIDFQGGRRGPVHYDVASFLWQARAGFPDAMKRILLDTYLEALGEYMPDVRREQFMDRLGLFVLFRTLQVLGAYGFRGYFEGKDHFIRSVPAAIANLRGLLEGRDLTTAGKTCPFSSYPYLSDTLARLAALPRFAPEVPGGAQLSKGLVVDVYSFSFRKGIPEDHSGNGGGYVFDCRSTHNPGRIPYYRQFTGLDPEVISFLENDGEITDFLSNVYPIVDHHVGRFVERGFDHLQIAFGCTGGQHRSVYCAQHTAEHIKERFGVCVHLVHREQGIDKVL